MGLLTFIQIPCHHGLANGNALNLKYHIRLKHFFNINLEIGIINKTTFFVCIFDISPCVFTQIQSGRCRLLQNLILHPTSTHNAYFWWTLLPKKQEIPEKCDDDVINTFFQVFLIFLSVINPHVTSPSQCRHFICWYTKGHFWIEGCLNTIYGHDMRCIHYPPNLPFYLFICWLLYATLIIATYVHTWLFLQHITYCMRVLSLQPTYKCVRGFPL